MPLTFTSARTGPKISSQAIRASGGTSAKIVGSTFLLATLAAPAGAQPPAPPSPVLSPEIAASRDVTPGRIEKAKPCKCEAMEFWQEKIANAKRG